MILRPASFKQIVVTAGTRVQLTTARRIVEGVQIQAEQSNTGQMYVGGPNVSATECFSELDSANAQILNPQALGWAHGKIDLSQIWIDASVSTDGVWVGYLEQVEEENE